MGRIAARSFLGIFLLGSLLTLAASSAAADRQRDEQAIRATIKQYLDALEHNDVKTITSLWVEDGDFIDESGHRRPARELFSVPAEDSKPGERAKMKVTSGAIRFLTDDVAIEDGTTEIAHPAGESLPALRGRFTAMWVKQDGKWKLASLREARLEHSQTAASLADLDWMTGEWSAKNEHAELDVMAAWNPNHTFLVRELKVVAEGKAVFTIIQRIGWDPLARKIKSWNFDSEGGYGEGLWTRQGNSWTVHAAGVLPDGRQTSSTSIYTPTDKDTFEWKSTSVHTSGEPAPDRDITFVRKRSAK